MKRKNLKPMIISALLAVGCAATTAGTTFALFTDRAETTIEVTAGKVELEVQFSNLAGYSLDEEDNTQQIPVAVEGVFATGGTYSLDANAETLTLDRMVPGDKVEFDVKLINKSNVKTKYRFSASKTGALAPYLEASLGAATLQWTELDIPASQSGDEIETAHVVINFPNTGSEITAREEGFDNGAQGLSAVYKLGYEMVQGNAQVSNDSAVSIEVEKTVTPTAPETPAGDYTFDIMSDDGLVGVAGIADDADPVTLVVTSDNTTAGNFTIEGATTANFDIDVEGRKPDTDVTVKLYVGEGFEQVYVFHENETTPLDNVEYNSQTGYVTFVTSSFSQYHFAGVKTELVAMVDGTGFTTLQNAWNVAKDKTVTLLKDLTQNGFYAYGAYTLDLNGHTLALRGHSAISGAFGTDGGANSTHTNLTIKNGVLNLTGANYSTYGIYNYGTLTLKDLTVNSACQTAIYSNGQQWGTAGVTTLDNVTLNATHTSGTALAAYAFKNSWAGTVKPTVAIKDSRITGAYNAVMLYGVDGTVENSAITATNNNALWISNSAMASGVTGTLTVKGNTAINACSDYKRLNAASGHTIAIVEGTYNFDPTSYVDGGAFSVTDNEDGTWTVVEA